MKFAASAASLVLAATSVIAGPVEKRQPQASASVSAIVSAAAPSTLPSSNPTALNANDIKNAVFAWRDDTLAVSNFLNRRGAGEDDDEFKADAASALASENDELTHKAVLDAQLCGTTDPSGCASTVNGSDDLQNANNVLVAQGTFGTVVTLLGDIAQDGLVDAHLVDTINFGIPIGAPNGRCPQVLPAIDTYFRTASDILIAQFGDDSLVGVTAVRPTACT